MHTRSRFEGVQPEGDDGEVVFNSNAQPRHESKLGMMPVLSFTLSPEGVVRIHDAILCLAKFSETVSLEAHRNNVGDLRRRCSWAVH